MPLRVGFSRANPILRYISSRSCGCSSTAALSRRELTGDDLSLPVCSSLSNRTSLVAACMFSSTLALLPKWYPRGTKTRAELARSIFIGLSPRNYSEMWRAQIFLRYRNSPNYLGNQGLFLLARFLTTCSGMLAEFALIHVTAFAWSRSIHALSVRSYILR